MGSKKILVISPSDISNDPRVLRHIEVAGEFGEVYTCGYGRKPNGSLRHFQIETGVRYLTRSLINLLAMQCGAHQFAARRTQFYFEATKMLRGRQFDVVIANDVHSIQTVVDLFPKGNIWVDMHEYAPREAEHDWRWRLAYQRHIRFLCKRHLRKVAVVSSVSKAICLEYEKNLDRKLVLIRNSADFRISDLNQVKKESNTIRCVHVGAAIRARELEKLIEAVGELNHKGFTLDLFLIPTDSRYLSFLVENAQKYPNITIQQPVDQKDLVETISEYEIGCISIPPTSFNYQNCLPNKFFQYVQARLPVMTGPIPEVAELILEENIGWISKGFESLDTKQCLLEITQADIQSKRRQMNEAAKRLSSSTDNDTRRAVVIDILNHE